MDRITFQTRDLQVFSRATTAKKKNSPQQNPFGISFKGRILTSDVFESSNPSQSGLKEKISEKGKLYASAVVGSISSIKASLNRAFAPVVAFAGKLNQEISNTWRKLEETDVTKVFDGIRKEYQVRKLMQKSVPDLRDQLTCALAVS